MKPLLRLTGSEHTAGAIVDVWGRAQQHEVLTLPDVTRVLVADPGLVLATPSLSGIIAVTLRHSGGKTRGHVRLVAVDAAEQRRGQATGLLDAAEAWFAEQGASSIRWGAEAPWYLWPGIDNDWRPAMTLARDRGYRCTAEAVNLSVATDFRAPTPTGVEVERLSADPVHAAHVSTARAMVAQHWASWLVEFDLAVESGTLFVAFADAAALAFVAHSTLRQGWIGPMGTSPQHRRHGVGAALLSAACADLSERGISTAQIAWVGPVSYFTKLGARPHRTFVQVEKQSFGPHAISRSTS